MSELNGKSEVNENPENSKSSEVSEANENARQEALDNIDSDLSPENEDTETDTSDDSEHRLYSTYDERLKQTPVNDGHWDGERGESTFYSNNEEANKYLHEAGEDGVAYKDAIPDFSEVSKGDVEIDDMSEDRYKNFKQADQKLADEKGCTPRDVAEWRENNGYTWHECNDTRTCQKIPSSVNSTFGHLGGVSECKKRDMEDDFDE